jgi:predicted ribosome quality control (RQC) complex YloA/Tae2 family protein
MDNFYLSAVVREMEREIADRSVGRIFLSGSNLFFDLHLESGLTLEASLDPASPALFLSNKDSKQLSANHSPSHPFALQLRKRIEGGQLLSVDKNPCDRIVRLDFEKYDASGDRARSSVILSLIGRSANAFLLDSDLNEIAALSDRAAMPAISNDFENAVSLKSKLLAHVDDSMTEAEILANQFTPASIFSPLIKAEFIARSRILEPARAFRSIVADLFDHPPTPLIYSRLPIDESSRRLINPKADLLLSQIELQQAEGMEKNKFTFLSEAADAYYSIRADQKSLQARFNSTRQILVREIKKRETVAAALVRDRERFEDPDGLKKNGDLLLANLATARADGTKATVVDFFDPQQREIEIEIEEGKPLQQSAANYFSRYQKARRALAAIAHREGELSGQIEPLKTILRELEANPAEEQISKAQLALERRLGRSHQQGSESKNKQNEKRGAIAGRRFKTADGYEILVGRNDRENDSITFRESSPQDIWLHAADYPGSHVIIRNPRRKPVPHKAIVEAAELAAFYSQAKQEGKAAVHYTQRKFVSKPPRAKAGLVRLSSFKTVMVEPKCVLDKID